MDKKQILDDLTHPYISEEPDRVAKLVTIHKSAYEAAQGSHALVICTEWDEFVHLDYHKMYDIMEKPAFIFDGRKILDHEALIAIGFEVETIGKRFNQAANRRDNFW